MDDEIAQLLKSARADLARAKAEVARAAVAAIAAGVSERAASELLGVNRRTLRTWIGKGSR